MAVAITLSNVWYGTQLATLFFSFTTFATSFTSTYTLAYCAIVASLTISLYQDLTAAALKKSAGSSSASAANPEVTAKTPQAQALEFVNSLKPLVGPAKTHPTTPYVLLALSYLIVLPRSAITLIPFDIFAFFHVVNFTKTFVFPRLDVNVSIKNKAISILDVIATRYSELGFASAVQFQLLSLGISLFWALINTPLNLIGYGDGHTMLNYLTAFVWITFVMTVQSQNLLMRAGITKIVTIVDGVVADPRVPVNVKDAWVRTKHIVKNKNLDHAQ